MKSKIKAGIIEGSGHAYLELVRIITAHPGVDPVFLNNDTNDPNHKSAISKKDLSQKSGTIISVANKNQIDVLFICGDAESGKEILHDYKIPKKIKIICLSGGFNEKKDLVFEGRKFIYGLPEIKKETIQKANNISVPGATATCVALGLLPIAQKKLLKDVYTTGISGSTENGTRSAENETGESHKVKSADVASNTTLHEMRQSLVKLSKGDDNWSIHFVPWKGEFSRGIFVTSQLKCTESLSEMYYIFEKFYADRKFIHISKEPVFLKKVINTNDCYINLEKAGDILVVHSAIDNLMKGAAGQAIQNMNLMFGFDETMGLIPESKKRKRK